jgi:cobaltochelatase CobN
MTNPLKTKREVIGQITVCSGCCCGAVQRGKPEVPLEWLKSEWRSRGLLKTVQLTISGCLGPCDLPNVVRISGSLRDVWVGRLTRFEQYSELADWAVSSRDAGLLLPLPAKFSELQFDPFRQEAALRPPAMGPQERSDA